MINATLRYLLIATCICLAVHRAAAQNYNLTLDANENEILVGMPVFITATLTNISRTDQKGYKVMGYMRVLIRTDNEDSYALYEAGVYPKLKIKPRLRTIESGESWEFREIILYQGVYDPYAGNPKRNESGLRLKDTGRYWIVGKYNVAPGQWIESDPIAIDVFEPMNHEDRWVFDMLTCRDPESQRKQLSDKDRLQCMNRYFYLLHLGIDPYFSTGVRMVYFPEYAKSLWDILEQGAGASRYGPAIKWALHKHSNRQNARQKQRHDTQHKQVLTKEKKLLIKNAPTFKRGTN